MGKAGIEDTAGGSRIGGWILLAIAAAVALALCGLLVTALAFGSWTRGTEAVDPDEAPSERAGGASARSDDRNGSRHPGDEPHAGGSDEGGVEPDEGEVDADEAGYEELECVFSGSALIDPGLPYDLFGKSAQSMHLTTGSTFECDGPPAETSGVVSMQASFDELGLFSGLGRGGGVIEWTDTGLANSDEQLSNGRGAESRTWNEIELLYPEIVVWVTIDDGPWAGFEGKLVLVDWQRIEDETGRIVEIVFEPTEVVFSPA